MMVHITINNKSLEVSADCTILEAAEQLGIRIPTMCYHQDYEASTSCMVCVVQVVGFKHLVPACATRVADGMVIETDTEVVIQARKTALELLLSDHAGDCLGPCVSGCPAHMNIPKMLREMAAGRMELAIETIRADIPLPAVLGRICPAPCEKVCRRAGVDEAVSICLLKRYAADIDLRADWSFRPECQPDNGKKVAVIGAGPAGLSAGYYLGQMGYRCEIFDENKKSGGNLRQINEAVLPREILDKEIEQILLPNVTVHNGWRVSAKDNLGAICAEFDAVLIATGKFGAALFADSGIEIKNSVIKVKKPSFATGREGVFAAGQVIGRRPLCVRATADGKEAAWEIDRYCMGQGEPGSAVFNSRLGQVDEQELKEFQKQADAAVREVPEDMRLGFTLEQARQEAMRCLHCDCRKADHCKLRDLATEYAVKATRFNGQRKRFEMVYEHPEIVYEPGKCIQCGLCIQAVRKYSESLGLSFVGRGFDVRVGVPFDKDIRAGLDVAGRECVGVCPTGALAFKENF